MSCHMDAYNSLYAKPSVNNLRRRALVPMDLVNKHKMEGGLVLAIALALLLLKPKLVADPAPDAKNPDKKKLNVKRWLLWSAALGAAAVVAHRQFAKKQ